MADPFCGLQDLVEPERGQDAALEVRHRVHELNGVGLVIHDGELDGTHAVAKGVGHFGRIAAVDVTDEVMPGCGA